MHSCPPKRNCKFCKAEYMRKYRYDGRYFDAEQKYSKKIKNTPMSTAKTAVFIEIRSGRLPKPSNQYCVDCGNLAQVYDHRDYLKPLDIEPVCRSCNKLRGPGKNRGF